MILADKIIENRKKNGWSQEELADKLGVSRQSVSKWESAQAVPDMKKILQMSEIFGVSTDYLLKDEITVPVQTENLPVDPGTSEEETVKVSMEEANSFLAFNEKAASIVSTGVMLCILSPILLITLGGLADAGKVPVSEYTAGIGGVIILLLIVASAVGMFLYTGFNGRPYEYLENSNIDTAYGVSGMVKERKEAYASAHSKWMIIGIMLCIVAAVPMFMIELTGWRHDDGSLVAVGVGAMLAVVAIGVKMIVNTSILWGGMDKLLEEGDYTRLNKKAGRFDGIYWAIATTVYLGWSFITQRWDFTWIIWPIAGVLFAAYREIMKAIVRSGQK